MSVSPPASVAVRRSSRCDGYSWSGAANEPLATPAKAWIGCAWQFDGQWCMTSSQLSALAGSVPSSASVAEPENEIDVADLPGVPARGVDDRGDGGVVPDA